MHPLLGFFLLCISPAQTTTEWIETALKHESLGQYKEAEQLLRKALAHGDEKDRHKTGIILNNLGGVLLSQGRYLEAETALNRSLFYLQREPGAGIDWTAPLNHLAMLYRETGRLRESEESYRRVLAARSAVLPAESAQLARTQTNLAALLITREIYPEAKQLLERAFATFSNLPGTDFDRLSVVMNLTIVDVFNGDLTRAAARASEAIALTGGPDNPHPMMGKALLNLGRIQLRLGQNQAAETCLRRSSQILRMHLHAGHPLLAWVIWSHAEALQKCGKSRDAKQLKREALSIVAANRELNPHALKVDAKDLRIEALR